MSKSTTRRAVLAGAAATPALALPAVALPAEPDPIFAAIERHRAALHARLVAARARFVLMEADPNVDREALLAANVVDYEASGALEDASWAFVDRPPTTISGALALVAYIERFNSGAFIEPADPERDLEEWRSMPLYWPKVDDDADVDETEAATRWTFDLLAAVVRSLAGKAVAS